MGSRPEDLNLETVVKDLGLDGPGISMRDVSRMSLETFVTERSLGRRLKSHGWVKLSGPTIEEHTAPLDGAGYVMVALQKLVNAVGAGLSNITSRQGRLPDWVRERTSLGLTPQMNPGSLVFQIEAIRAPQDELSPTGEVRIDEDVPLVDQAFTKALSLLEMPANQRLLDELGVQLKGLGPRVAGSLDSLAEALSANSFNIDLQWDVPTMMPERASLNHLEAELLHRFVNEGKFDQAEITFSAKLRTISDRRMWEVQTEDGEIIRLDTTDLPAPTVRRFFVGDPVEVRATWSVENLPSGTERNRYVVIDVRSGRGPRLAGERPAEDPAAG